MNAVVSPVPFHCTCAPLAKAEPEIVSVKLVPPATATFGAMELMAGSALTMLSVTAFDVPPLTTVIVAEEGVATQLAGTTAVNWLALTKVVPNGEPFQLTCALEAKPTPLTASVKPLPPA